MSNTSLYSHVDKHSRLMYLFVLENKPFSWGLTFCLPGLRNVDKNIYVWCKIYINKLMITYTWMNRITMGFFETYKFWRKDVQLFYDQFEAVFHYKRISYLRLLAKIQGHIKLMKCSISRTDILWKWCIRFSLNETPSKLISVFFRSAISQT